MLSKKDSKLISALHHKKFRQFYRLFLVEGHKSVFELLSQEKFKAEVLLSTPAYQQKYATICNQRKIRLETVTEAELERLSTLQSNDSALAVVCMPEPMPYVHKAGQYALMLDDIRDPGNLGTIIRVADWYGISNIVCSSSTADWYNPKVIAASKGSFLRVNPHYTELEAFLENSAEAAVVGAMLDGVSVHDYTFPSRGGFLVMGNESAGVAEALQARLTDRITIPRYGRAESLNVGTATAILCDHLRRTHQP